MTTSRAACRRLAAMDQTTDRRGGLLFDVLIASVLTVFAQVDLRFNIDQSVHYGPVLAVAIVTAIATGVLALRRRAARHRLCRRRRDRRTRDFHPAHDHAVGRFPAAAGCRVRGRALGRSAGRDDRRGDRRVRGRGAVRSVPVIGTVANVPFTFVPLIGAIVAGRVLAHRHRTHTMARDLARQLESDRDESIRAAITEERNRIARELHDIVAHCVSVMVVQAGAAEDLLERDPAAAIEPLRSVQETGRDAVGELERMLGLLRGEGSALALKPQPGTGQLTDLTEQMNLVGLPVVLTIEGSVRQLPPGAELTIYRIAQEALTNTLKHANAAKASVVLRYTDDSVELEVTDDGPGGTGTGHGHGLIGMHERAALYGGSLSAGPRSSGGYGVRVELPMAVAAR